MDTTYSVTHAVDDHRLRVDFADQAFLADVGFRLSTVQRVSVRATFALVAPEAEAAARRVLDEAALHHDPAWLAAEAARKQADAEAGAAREKAEKATKVRTAKEAKAAREANAAGMRQLRGDTYPHREAIRAAGGEWDRKAGTWNVPADRLDEMTALVRGGSDMRRQQDAARAAEQAAYDTADASRRKVEVAGAMAAAAVARDRAEREAALLAEVTPMVIAAAVFEEFEGNIGGPYASKMPRAEVLSPDGRSADFTKLCTVSRRTRSARVDVGCIRVPVLPAGWSVRVEYTHCSRRRCEVVQGRATDTPADLLTR